jgi:hypothetical protein
MELLGKDRVDVLFRLRNYRIRSKRSKTLLYTNESIPSPHNPVPVFSLLVNGFLRDSEIFRSYGWENLYERGVLNMNCGSTLNSNNLKEISMS